MKSLWKFVCLPIALMANFEDFVEFAEFEEFEEELVEIDEPTSIDVSLHIEGLPAFLGELIVKHVNSGSTVVDFGETHATTQAFSRIVGPFGRVITLDFAKKISCIDFINIFPFPVDLEDIEFNLDDLEIENLAFIKIDAWGKEDEVLKGAKKTIASQKPCLLINMLGGIPIENVDRYVKGELSERLEWIRNMGYQVERVKDSYYLATCRD